MRRNIILLFAIALLFFCNIGVDAVEIVCEYEDLELTMTYDTEKDFDKNSNPFLEMGDYSSNSTPINLLLVKWGKDLKNTDYTEIDQNLYKSVLNDYACPTKMHVCTQIERFGLYKVSLDLDLIYAIFSGDWEVFDAAILNFSSKVMIMTEKEYRDSGYEYQLGEKHFVLGQDWENKGVWENIGALLSAITGWGNNDPIYTHRETACQFTEYMGPYIGVNINCSLLKNKMLDFIIKIADYKDCGDNQYCKSQAVSGVKTAEDNIKSQCRSILENYNYTGGEAECIDDCLSIKDKLDEYKAGTDLAEEHNSGDCGFSARLLTWLSNILRWVKYILPVFVIILGILDFIKAIGSDKEEDMKKAQKSFVIRLIAAALVFIVPLILEFVLDKMGFGYDSCSLF